LKDSFRTFEFNESACLINSDEEIGTSTDSPRATNKGKSNRYWQVKDIGNDVSRTLEYDKKAMPTVSQEDIHVCSDVEHLLQNCDGTAGAKAAEIEDSGRDPS
jgi:hypothetical protein